jgi:hypothetical protein
MQKQKIRTTVILDKSIIKQIKRVALEKETTQTEIINDYLQKGLNNENTEKKGNSEDKYNFEDMIGMISEDTNAMELKRKGQGRGDSY